MKFITAGVGPGDPELVTVKAINALKGADLVVIPISARDKESVAESIIREHLGNVPVLRLVFPMISDAAKRDAELREQLEHTKEQWRGAQKIVMPVIGDATLYATSAYLYDVWREFEPALELELIPGISAHAAICARVGKFMALGDDVLSIIPGTADADRIKAALGAANSAALFKPSALKGELRRTVQNAGPWEEIVRVDRAGMPEENVLRGSAALDAPDEYLSTLMLWRKS